MSGATFFWSQGVGAATGSPPQPSTWIPDQTSGVPITNTFNNVNFMNIDSWNFTGKTGYSDYTAHPVQVLASATNYSYEKWLRAYFQFASGITNTINNCHFYRGNTNGMNDTALAIYAAVQGTYLTPQGGAKRSGGAGTYPILSYASSAWQGPIAANTASSTSAFLGLASGNTRVSLYNGSTTGNYAITASNWTDWIVLQLEVPQTVTTPGNIGTLSWAFSYDES